MDASILSATNAEILALVPVARAGQDASRRETSVLRLDKNGAAFEMTVKSADTPVALFARDAFGKGAAILPSGRIRLRIQSVRVCK